MFDGDEKKDMILNRKKKDKNWMKTEYREMICTVQYNIEERHHVYVKCVV